MLSNSNILILDDLTAFSKNRVLLIEKQFFNSQIMFNFNFQIINQMKKKINFFSKKFADRNYFFHFHQHLNPLNTQLPTLNNTGLSSSET